MGGMGQTMVARREFMEAGGSQYGRGGRGSTRTSGSSRVGPRHGAGSDPASASP
jgi:hypothetical protein